MNLNQIHSVFLIGIGGIGMSALARYFNSKSIPVFGYDLTSSPLTKEMESNGISITYADNVEEINSSIKANKENILVIYTPAIPSDNLTWNYFKEENYTLKKRAEVLGMITEQYKTIAVAGTHGKTTTSSMIAVVMSQSGVKCNAFLGGIATNFNSNLVQYESAEWVVVEADEYDRSFLTLAPNVAVVTSTDADHLDIYGDSDSMNKSFQDFINKVNPSGKVFLQEEVKLSFGDTERYSLDNKKSNYYGENISVVNGDFVFDAVTPFGCIRNIKIGINGLHNIENALSTIAVCQEIGIDNQTIKNGLESYRGVKRRFEYVLKQEGLIFIDDYAHHPTEIKALVSSVRKLYPEKKITGIFQPHLFSRTKDFGDEFARELSQLDDVILLDIYPARELPIEGINVDFLLNKINGISKRKETKETLVESINRSELEVLLTIGAGDISTLVQLIKMKLKK
jgi:UDP-N-acetylmuramate--alanine ligase